MRERITSAIVFGVDALNHDAGHRGPVSGAEFDDLAGAGAPCHVRASVRDDRRAAGMEAAERAAIEMVTVRMGDENRVKREQPVDRRGGWLPADVEDTTEQRIGEEPHTRKLDQDGRMTDVRDGVRALRHYASPLTASGAVVRGGSPSSRRRQPISTSCTLAAPTIGSDGSGRSAG